MVGSEKLENRVDSGLLQQLRIEENPAQRDFVVHLVSVVVQELDAVAQHAVPQPVGGGGEFIGNAGIDVWIVTLVGRQRAVSQQGRQELVVGDRLQLADHQPASLLVDLLVGPEPMPGRQFVGQAIVLEHEKRVQRGQLDVFIGAGVAGQKHRFDRVPGGIVVRKASGVEGEQVAVARLQTAALAGAQRTSARFVGTVDLRTVDERRDAVDLLSRVVE